MQQRQTSKAKALHVGSTTRYLHRDCRLQSTEQMFVKDPTAASEAVGCLHCCLTGGEVQSQSCVIN